MITIRIGEDQIPFDETDAHAWKSQSAGAQLRFVDFPTKRGLLRLFVKRSAHFTGWGFLQKEMQCPEPSRVPATPTLRWAEKIGKFYYYATDRLEGDTLERTLAQNSSLLDSREVRWDLIRSVFFFLRALNNRGYWYSDLCKKNIFVSTPSPGGSNVRFYVIDVDSCIPNVTQFDHTIDNISREYSDYFPYANSKARGQDKVPTIKGTHVNQLEWAVFAAHAWQRLMPRKISGHWDRADTWFEKVLDASKEFTLLKSHSLNGTGNCNEVWQVAEKLLGKIEILCQSPVPAKVPVPVRLPILYQLIITANNGNVRLSPPGQHFLPGTEVELDAIADPGYRFLCWRGDLSSTHQRVRHKIAATIKVEALFVAERYRLTISPQKNGEIIVTPLESDYSPGAEVTLTACPRRGQRLSGWYGNVPKTGVKDREIVVQMDGNRHVVANFEPIPQLKWEPAIWPVIAFVCLLVSCCQWVAILDEKQGWQLGLNAFLKNVDPYCYYWAAGVAMIFGVGGAIRSQMLGANLASFCSVVFAILGFLSLAKNGDSLGNSLALPLSPLPQAQRSQSPQGQQAPGQSRSMPSNGWLLILSDPSGLSFQVDGPGAAAGTTPSYVGPALPGDYKVSVAMAGGPSQTSTQTLEVGKTNQTLFSFPAVLHIKTTPPGASIFRENELIGAVSDDLVLSNEVPGLRTYTAKLSGYEDGATNISLSAGLAYILNLELKRSLTDATNNFFRAWNGLRASRDSSRWPTLENRLNVLTNFAESELSFEFREHLRQARFLTELYRAARNAVGETLKRDSVPVGVAFPDLRADLQALEDSPSAREALEWLRTIFRNPRVEDFISVTNTETKLIQFLLAEMESGKLSLPDQERELLKLQSLASPHRVFDTRIEQNKSRLRRAKLEEAALRQAELKINQLLLRNDFNGAMNILVELPQQSTDPAFQRLQRKIDEAKRNSLPGTLMVIHAEASVADRTTRPVANAMTLGAEWYKIVLGTNNSTLQAYERRVSFSVPPGTYPLFITNVRKRGFGVFSSTKLVTNATVKVMPRETNTFIFHDRK